MMKINYLATCFSAATCFLLTITAALAQTNATETPTPPATNPIQDQKKESKPVEIFCSDVTQDRYETNTLTLYFQSYGKETFRLPDNIKDFITVKPAVPNLTLLVSERSVVFTGSFAPSTTYEIRVGKNLHSDAVSLRRDAVLQYRTRIAGPTLCFTSSGIVFPKNAKNFSLPFSSRNIHSLRISAFQMYDSNLSLTAFPNFFTTQRDGKPLVKDLLLPLNAPKDRTSFHNLDLNTILPKNQPGVYGIRISEDRKTRADSLDWYWDRSDECVITVTDLVPSVTLDTANRRITVSVFSIASGEPEPGVTVQLWSRKNQLIAQGESAREPITLPFRPEFESEHDSISHVVVRKDGDAAFLPLSHDAIFLPNNDGRQAASGPCAFVYAERNILRPGETISPALFARHLVTEGERDTLRPMPNAPLRLFLIDPLGNTIAEKEVRTSPEGFADTSFEIPKSAQTGTYRILCGTSRNTVFGSMNFLVSLYVEDRMHVSLSSDKNDVSANQPVTFQPSAKYYFGSDVANASIRFHLFSDSPHRPAHFGNWTVGDPAKRVPIAPFSESGTYGQGNHFLTDGQGNHFLWPGFAKSGAVSFQPEKLLATVTVSEPGSRSVSAHTPLIVYPTDLFLGLRSAKSAIELTILPARTGQALPPDAVPVKISLARKTWHYNTKRNGDRIYREWESLENPVNEFSRELSLSGGAIESLDITKLAPGEYVLTAENESMKLRTRHEFWHSQGESGFRSKDPNRILFKTDKPRYNPGDTAIIDMEIPSDGANVLILSGESGVEQTLTFATERKGIRTFRISIPNELETESFHAAVTMVLPPDAKTPILRKFGFLTLPVEQNSHRIQATLLLPEIALPRTEIPLKITLSDAKGKPTSGLVHVFAADEGILALTNFQLPDIFTFFHGPVRWEPKSFDLFGSFYPDVKLLPDGSVGGDAMKENYRALPTLSKHHLELNLKPAAVVMLKPVTVPESGEVTIPFPTPDLTGAIRVMAVASNPSAVGSACTNLILRNPLSALLSAPAAVGPDDSFELTCTIFNHDRPEEEYTLTIRLPDGVAAEKNIVFQGKLPKGKSKTHVVPCRVALGLEKIPFTATISVGAATHSADFVSTVRPPVQKSSASELIVLKPGEDITVEFNPADWTRAEYAVSVSGSPAIQAQDAMNFLLQYPYGCLEQTTSAAFPFLATGNLVKAGLLSPDAAETAKDKVAVAYSSLLSMLRHNGEFSMWPGGDTAWTHAGVYAAHFIFEAAEKKLIRPDKQILSLIQRHLRNLLSARDVVQDRLLLAYAAYALAVSGSDSFLTPARNLLNVDKPDFPSMIAACALIRGGYAAEGAERLGEILPNEVWRDAKPLCGYSPTAGQAMALALLAENFPASKDIWKIASELQKKLRPDGSGWGVTQTNAWAVLGLAAVAAENPSDDTAEVTVTISGKKPERCKIPFDKFSLNPAEKITFRNHGKGVLLLRKMVNGFPAKMPETAGPIQLRREFRNEKDELVTRIKHGDRIRVTVFVSAPQRIEDLVLCDLLPAGLEIEDERLATRAAAFPASLAKSTYSRLGLVPKCLEKRIDRLLFFGSFEKRSDGQEASFSYTARAVSKGDFSIPPLVAEDMYDPDLKGVFLQKDRFVIE